MKLLYRERKDIAAFFVTNYKITVGAILMLNELGLHVPDNLSLISFDNLDLAKIILPTLSMVEQPIAEIGHKAAKRMLARLEGKQENPIKKF